MNGLKTARVVIVDDTINEGAALLRAFSKRKIGASFFTGNPDELPDEKLSGIRLLALDMDLTGGAVEECKAFLSPLLSVVTGLIANNAAPFILLAWTKHPECVEDFKGMLKEARPDLNPYFMVAIAKDSVKKDDKPEDFDIDKILKVINDNLEGCFPFDLIMDWEQRVHDSATDTITSLIRLVNPDKWQEEMSRIVGALAVASGGQREQNQSSALKSLFDTLNPIQDDRLENLPIDTVKLSKQADQLLKLIQEELEEKGKSKSHVSPERSGQLNKMLLMATVSSPDLPLRPGNIYFKEGWSTADYPLENMDKGQFVMEYVNIKNLPKKKEDIKDIICKSLPSIIEITPACDYSQNNVKTTRLIPCLFVPIEMKAYFLERAQFLKKIGPILIEGSTLCPAKGTYLLWLNSRHVFGISREALMSKKAAFRLRKQILVDVQSWFASQAARPGYVSL